jgi:hypothetical protein
VSKKNDNDLTREALALPREIEPARDLWKGIEGRIQAKARRNVVARRALTSATILLAAAAVILSIRARGKLGGGDHASSPPLAASQKPASQAPSAPSAAAPAAPEDEVVFPEEESYRAALVALTPTFVEKAKLLPEKDLARVGASLHAINEAIVATRASLVEHPDDDDLRGELGAEYQQEIDAMNDVLDWTTRS